MVPDPETFLTLSTAEQLPAVRAALRHAAPETLPASLPPVDAFEGTDEEAAVLLCDASRLDANEGTYATFGEPQSSHPCAQCHATIPVGAPAATTHYYALDPRRNDVPSPRIVCQNCLSAEAKAVRRPKLVTVVAFGTLARRRPRPGDPTRAPYLLHLADVDEALPPFILGPISSAPSDVSFWSS
jgi:hypothetical protein